MAISNGRYVVTGGYLDPSGNIVEEKQWQPGRYVVTGGYMDPNGNIIEETQFVPDNGQYSTSTPAYTNNNVNVGGSGISINDMFSPADTYKFTADGYYNQGNTALGDAYSALWSGSDAFSKTARQINDFYNTVGSDIYNREMALAGVKSDLANKLYADMNQTKQYVMDTFGPEGSLTKEINTYYDDLGNYLATDAGRQAANIAAQGMQSGASLGAIRAQQNEAYNESFARYVQAKEQEINAKQTIASNLINYMSTLRKEYGDTTNDYIIAQYERANDLLNTISQSIANSNIELAATKLTHSLGGSGSGNSSSGNNWSYFKEFSMDQLSNSTSKELWDGLTDAEKVARYNGWIRDQTDKILRNGGNPGTVSPTTTTTTTTTDNNGNSPLGVVNGS